MGLVIILKKDVKLSERYHSPQQPRYVVRPIVREHYKEETHSNENDTRQFHASEIGTVQHHIQCWNNVYY